MSDWAFPNAATPTGSAAYYAVRFSATELHDELAAAFAWRAELGHIVVKAHDPGVARLKLDWWREELHRAQSGSPRHPLSMALTGLVNRPGALERAQTMLDAIEDDIRKLQPNDTGAFHDHCDRLGGAFGELLATIASETDCDTLTAARNLGSYAEAIERVTDLASYLQLGFCPLPREPLHAKGLGEAALRAKRATGLPSVLHDITQFRAQIVEQIIVSGTAIAPITAAHRLAAQAMVLRCKLAEKHYPVLNQRTELLPLRRLWAAWRLR